MAADGGRVVVLGALIVMMVSGHVSVTVALVALGLLSTAEVFADNTASTLTPMLVRRDDLAVANSRLQGGFITLNQLAGPPIGAALFAAGRAWPFVAQTVLVAAGVLLGSRITLPPHSAADAASRSPWRDIVEGFRWTVHHAAVRTLALTILIFNVTFGAAWSVLVLYAQQRLGLGPVGFGLMMTVSAAGGLVGTGLYGWITRRVSLGNVMRAGLIIETLTHLALAVTTSPWVAAAIFFAFGAHAFIWGTTSMTVRQRAVPDHLQGRVTSVNTICVYGGLVIGSAIGGVLASRAGVTAPFWFAFAGSAVFVVALWRQLTRIAHADRQS
jgi:predicted MFS family arabinose efflux permease